MEEFSQADLKIEFSEGLSPQEQVDKVAESFAIVSNEYEALDNLQLPPYLPSEELSELHVYRVYKKFRTKKRLHLRLTYQKCVDSNHFMREENK